MKTKLLIPMLLLLSVGAAAQTTRQEILKDLNRTGANYYIYPGPSLKTLTPAPAGYEPFYISHFGRHGSRYMEDNTYYVYAIEKLDTAALLGILTPKGLEVLEKLRIAYADAWNRDGDLTPLGGLQHREIAGRMYQRFPQLLSQPLRVDARSSTSGRCMISMFYFCQELQGLNPALDIRMDASKRDMSFVVRDEHVELEETPAMEGYEQQINAMYMKTVNAPRFMKSLFTDVPRAESFVEGPALMECLFNVASDLQNVPALNLSLMDVFSKEELFQTWKTLNSSIMLHCGLVPGSTPEYRMVKPVRDSLVSFADRVISQGDPALTLRFTHDGTILPLAYLLGLKEATGCTTDLENLYKSISVDKLIPMAANIQLVFYRKEGSDDILVKFLLNENETSIPIKTDVSPYYHWKDVKSYWEGRN